MYSLCFIVLIGISNGFNMSQCVIPKNNDRLDCHPQKYANEYDCLARGCCWLQPLKSNNKHKEIPSSIPHCYYPTNYPKYYIKSLRKSNRGIKAKLVKHQQTYLPNEISLLNLEVIYETKSRVRIKITDSQNERFEVPIKLTPPDSNLPSNLEYEVIIPSDGTFSIEIKRKSDNKSLYKSFGPLFYSDQFIQISSLMSTDQVYGMGEQNRPFLHQLSNGWTRIGLWARDNAIETYQNLYGTHPFYMGMPEDGKAFGVFYLNSNAQEFVLQPTPAITYRTIGGILDIFIFTGGSPEETVQQYVELVGKPMLPPYWSLGFQLSRWGYKDLNELKDTFQRNIMAGFPISVQWADIDYMEEFKDFTIDQNRFAELGNYIKEIRKKHDSRFVAIIDPGISSTSKTNYSPYDDGLEMNVFIKDSISKKPIIGQVWPGETVYPDFTHPNISNYWTKHIQKFYKLAPVDGLWIDMNEPSNFYEGSKYGCPVNDKYDNPYFMPNIRDKSLFAKTICPSSLHYNNVKHYDLHNLYGYTESIITNKALLETIPEKRPFILSRSTFSGSGKYTFHWTGDNNADWDNLRNSIRQILNFNMFGIPMTGADICGFNSNSNEELCIRWMQLGVFYPFMRNHNSKDLIEQDPASFQLSAQKIMKTAVNIRYALLPTFYTLLVKSHLYGGTVMRPMSFEFYSDKNTHSLDLQFMIGSSIMVAPVVHQGATTVNTYFPGGVWYDFSNGKLLRSSSQSAWQSLNAPLDTINIAIRGGHIIAMSESLRTYNPSIPNKILLYVAMSEDMLASGDLFWDDGESIDSYSNNKYSHIQFTADRNNLNVLFNFQGYKDLPVLSDIIIYGLKRSDITRVTIGNYQPKFIFDSKHSSLIIKDINETINSNINISWS